MSAGPAATLTCAGCSGRFSLAHVIRCAQCHEPLEIAHLPPALGAGWFGTPRTGSLFERYAPFFGFLPIDPSLTLGEGQTPLVRTARLARLAGIAQVLVKNEAQNPTWSFKDRGTALSVQHAVALGYRRLATLSSGNMAASVAAFGARAGLETRVLLKGNTPDEKIGPVTIYGAQAARIESDYGAAYRDAIADASSQDTFFSLSDEPFRVEGYKTIAFELFEQLGCRVPDCVATPVGSGGLLRGIVKGFEQLCAVGAADRMPRFVGAQSEGCFPVVAAFEAGRDRIERFPNPETLDHVLENPFPPSGNQVLRKVRQHGGAFVRVRHTDVLEAEVQLAREGLFVQPASATAFAGLVRAVETGLIPRSALAVVVVTGSGLKYPAILARLAAHVRSTASSGAS